MTTLEIIGEAIENCRELGSVTLRPDRGDYAEFIRQLQAECTSSVEQGQGTLFQGWEGGRPWTIIVQQPETTRLTLAGTK